ncbi:HAD-IC family P-type ATPase [Nitrososphaera viennensis]|uniref:Potassium-transporting ATPase ATP-binding subunit n=2 Tax=Nitrososphaera viennensis TaxID=1034015 RepID=A0A060HPD2_9ARCH|nr:HAD-IC family P-type ATPase [Nitrososphaera viennensis]AIC16990.1 potassium translocating ATPase, subunit B [Nitrososphaera viennensis EN76]UVS68890.1 HAD-IC family P-type ATPase [Nitrososphaera viennensis]
MSKNNNNNIQTARGKKESAISGRVIRDSITKMSPYDLARNSPVMFAVEVGFFLVLAIAVFPDISNEYVNKSQVFYIESAIILILTVWFATFSESLSEAQARARVDSLRSLEKEVPARKWVNGKETIVTSTSLKPGDEVIVHAGEIIPRDGLVNEGKAFVDESMMTGESNPVFKEKGDRVIGGTRVASDKLLVEISAEIGRSFLDQMVGLIESATRPKTKNEIALTILLAGLSIIFIMVIGTLLFFARFLGYPVDIATLVALLVALMPTTIGALLPAIGVAGITRLGRDNIIAKSGKGIEAAGDCDVLVLDKTGTITEGSRSAIAFMPMQGFTEEDIGQAAFAASIHDTTHEGKSTVYLAEAKNFVPPLLEKIITAKPIEFSAETRYSGIELIPSKRATLEEMEAVKSFNGPVSSGCRVATMLREITRSNRNARILKGSIDAMLPMADNLNEAELKWKSQEVSKTGGTPLIVMIDRTAIGLVALKDNLKENIRQKLDEVRATGISTVMITGDNKLTAEVIAHEANVDQVIAEAKPTDKLRKVEEEQRRGHVIGMVGDGTNDAPALAKADVGLAMNSGTAAAKEAANMVDLDSDPSKILKVVKLGKQLLMTRGAITTFSIANDVAKYFALLPAMFMESNPKMQALNIMQLHSAETAVLSTLIFNAIIIPLLIPLALKGTRFKPEPPQKTFVRNMFIYGIGGAILPFAAIKGIDVLLSIFM